MRVSCIQMNSGLDMRENMERAGHWLAKAKEAGCDMAVLPENFAFMGGDDAAKIEVAETEGESTVLRFLSAQAARLNIAIIGGSAALKSSREDKIRNACAVFDHQGTQLGIYDKIHLFDVDVGGQCYRESAVVEAGSEPLQVHVSDWDIGLSICYDLRFPELYRRYSAAGCGLLSIVAAFTVPTGKAHWETLLRARAIENQCYVLASTQTGEHPGGRQTWGHAMVIDPWGKILCQLDEGEGMVTADLSMQEVESVRAGLPALQHRKL